LGGLSFSELALGFRTICGIAAQRAYCWGWNDVGQMGIGSFDNNDHSAPEPVALDSATSSITAGYRFGCLVATGVAYCWGDNQYGQLANGTISSGIIPYPAPDSVTGGHRFKAIAAGQYHACALDTADNAYCWGLNDVGELGTGATSSPIPNPSPVIGGLEFVLITAGVDHTCGIATDSLAYCWGGNSAGQLGDGTRESKTTPVPVSGGMKFSALDASRGFTCGVTVDQTAYCWGGNGLGRLGIGGFDQFQTVPAPVVGQRP
jgi:alpha-tubulin suppressor-like RCC1 family protein